MAMLSLKIKVVGSDVTKTMQFDPSTIIFDACRIIREKIPEAAVGNPADFGLFLADEDTKKGVWLEPGRSVEYYLLRNGDLLEYKKKQRILRVRMLDGTVKTLQVDDSHNVAQLMITICLRIGITNHEEYSLVQELPEDERQKTLTLKRDKSIAKDQKKLDELKKKLHTDDELNWLDHSKTLREQGIDVNETLLLRRKFFFSDQNVDARDPVQLNLLYVQTRDAILKGAHPVTMEEALQFAGMQCQVQFGDYNEQKHKPGFLELKEFLPKEYMKLKVMDKKIFGQHKNMTGLSEIDGKVKYTQMARSLKTYGITFFLVKEKMKGKNKLTPRLLGITKDSVVRVDEKTKEILKEWPLTTVRRWAASPNSFTLDFGDYSDSYYSVQTQEGEQISQLIAGYIDIILKKKKAKDHFGIEGDEESTMYEDSVSPAKATIIQHQSSSVGHANIGSVALPAVLRAGDSGQSAIQMGSMQQAQFSQVSNQAHSGHLSSSGQNAQVQGVSQAQRAFLGTIDHGMGAIGDAQAELERKAELPQLGADAASRQWKQQKEDMSKQSVGAQLSAMNAATAQVVTLTSGGPDETDYGAVGSAVATISSNVGMFSKDVKMLAALQEEEVDGDRLLDAARRLAGAFSDLLKAAQPGTQEPRQNLLSAANRIGEASHDIMRKVGEDEEDGDRAFEDALLALAKAVANATAALVLKAKGVASKCENQVLQNKVISSATQCALATSQLVACTKVVAPTIQNPGCQEQLVEAAKAVAKSVEGVVDTSRSASKDDKTLQDLGGAATAVTKALNDLLQHIRKGTGDRESNEGQVDTILTATDKLFGSMGDTPEMVKQARILAQATSQLVNAIKCQAETHPDSEIQKKLLAAAKMLADATARMVEAAKESGHKNTLRRAAEELCAATTTLTTDILKERKVEKRKSRHVRHHMKKAVEELCYATNTLTTEILEGYQSDTDTIHKKSLRKAAENVCKVTTLLASDILEGYQSDSAEPKGTLTLKRAAEDLCTATNTLANDILEGYTSDNQGYTSERESNKPSNKPRTLQRAVKELWVSSHDLTKDITETYSNVVKQSERKKKLRDAVKEVAVATSTLTSDILEGYTSESGVSDSEVDEKMSLRKAAEKLGSVTSTLTIDLEDYRDKRKSWTRRERFQRAAKDLASATNTLASNILEGYSTDGYTTDGYTTEGYTTEGYTTEGYTTDGYTTDECFTETEEVTLRKEKYERRERLEQNKKYRTSLKIFAEDLCLATSDLTKTMMEGYQSERECSSTRKNLEEAAQRVVTATSILTLDLLDDGTIRRKDKNKKNEDSNRQRKSRLEQAVEQVVTATSTLSSDILYKGCASNPQDSNHQHGLRQAAEELRSATNAAAANALKRKLIKKLEMSAKNAAAATTQLINAAQAATPFNKNIPSQTQLMQQCKLVADQNIPKLVQGIKGTMASPDYASAQLVLISAAQDMIQPGTRLVTGSKAAVPTISDQPTSSSLTNAAKNLAAALAELRAASSTAQDACRSLEIEGALDQVLSLERELLEIKKTAASGKLVPLPGETAESSANQLGTTSKTVGSSMAQLLTAAAQGNENYTGIAARDTANALKVLMSAVRGVAATTDDRKLQEKICDCALDVMDKSSNLIEEAKKAVNNPNNPDNQVRLAQVAKAVSHALNNCVNCLPGLREIEQSIKQVTTASQRLQTLQFPESHRSFQEVQVQMNNSAVNLNQAASEIVTASRGPPQQVAESSSRFSRSYADFMDSGLVFAGATKDQENRRQIVSGLRSVSMMSSKLLLASKSLQADPNAPNSKNLLAQAARQVTESINHLINICTVSAPGQKECDNALRQIQMMKNVIENPSEPISDASYFECFDGVMDKSKSLGMSMTGISNHAKHGELDPFCDSVVSFATAVCGLTENSAQAAYLVGISDPASEPGRPGLVDQSQFARANQAIQMACQNLTNPAATQQQVLSAATIVAKHTSSLCNTCRLASSKTNNPVAKRHFVQSAKDVANSTANLVKAIKVLDNEFSDDNRRRCAEAAKPLITAVDELTTFASSPEFASIPAKISHHARKAQEPVRSASVQLIDGACHMVQAAKQLAVNPKDPPTYQQYSAHSKSVSDAIKKLLGAIKDSAPGQRECDASLEKVNAAIRDLDQAALASISQSLATRDENSFQGFQDQMMNAAREILESIEPIRNAAKQEAEKLGYLVLNLSTYMDPLAVGAIGAASKTLNSKQQMAILDQTKSVAESALQLTYAAKEGGGNPKAVHTHNAIDEAVDGMRETLQDLICTLEEANSQAGVVTAMIDNMSKAISKTEDRALATENMSYVDYQTNMVRLAKQIARVAQDMVGKSGTNVAELGGLANILTRDFTSLATDSCGAMATSSSPEIANRIKSAIQELGKSCMNLVQDAGNLQSNPTDSFSRRDITDHGRHVSEKVSKVLAALQAGSRGTQACINAASTVSGIIGDLDTTIMFASAGTLNAEGEEGFADHRENILKTAKSLVEDTKTLVAGAASNQEELAQAAQSAVMTITKLSDCVKHGAASLGSEQPEAQVLLINAVKDVAAALGDLISATKNASGKPAQDPAMSTLKDSAKVMVTNVTSLLKTVKTVEDEAARGTRALESSIEAIGQELKNFVASDRVEKRITPEELIRSTRHITTATAKAVAAGNSGKQDDVIAAANLGRRAISDVLYATKGAAAGADSPDIKHRALIAGKNTANAYKELLEQVNMVILKPTPEQKHRLAALSKRVATMVTELIHSAEAIKGNDWVDPEDPLMIAEAELLGAANSIEAASRKLAQLQPRRQPKTADESLNFEEQILAAAQSIAGATAALVKAASAAQRELVEQGKVGAYSIDHDEDNQWSEGLISAARMVAAATHSLCDAANAMVQGHASEEKLISSAKQVASSTAQLLVACKVKANSDSVAMKRLQGAGNAVKRATDALVRSAQQAAGSWPNEEEDSVNINQRMVGGLAQIIMAQEEILIKERELESARRKLETIRKAKYKDHPSDDDSSGSAF